MANVSRTAFGDLNKRLYLATASLLVTTALAQPAWSQTTTPAPAPSVPEAANTDTGEDVVVTGYRASLESAIEAKRDSLNIVDVIKADDIASFPDANLAESIQRIPGVSITRDAGEGRNVTVRGLGGDFVRTLLNGIEAFSATTGSTLGQVAGINRTRGFDYSTFASELFNSITVSKSQSAEMDEGSLAATIDLQTARPFDKRGLRGAISAQGAYYDNNKTYAPRIAGLISNTFGDFGALVSVAYSKRKAQEDGYSDTSQSDFSDALNGFCGRATDDPTQAGSQVINTVIPFVNPLSGSNTVAPFGRPANQCFSNKPSNDAAYSKVNVANVFLPRNPGLGRFTLDQKRLGVTVALQYNPSSDTVITLDGVYSQFDQNRRDFALSLASNNRNVNGASAAFPLFAGRVDSQLLDVNVDSTGQVDYMRIDNVDIKQIQEVSKTRTKTHEVGLTLHRQLSDNLVFDGKVGHAGSDYKQPYDVFISYDGFNKAGYSFDARNDSRRPLINYGYDVNNPANITFTNAGTGLTPDIRLVNARVRNNLFTAAANFGYSVTDALKLKVGAQYKQFKFIAEQNQRPATSGNNTPDLTKFGFAQFAADFPNISALSTSVTGFGGGLGLPPGSVTSWIVPDVDQFISKLSLLCNCVNKYGDFTVNTSAALAQNRNVREEDKALYTQADYNFDIGGHALRGNLGVRYVKTDVVSTGFTGATKVTVPYGYDDFLPSANASFEITPNLIARAAFAKVMARPGLGNLNPGGSINTTFGAQAVTIGNPRLDPYRARNYDLSFEYYPEKGAFYGVALFYKDVLSTIQTVTELNVPFANTGLPLNLLPVGQDGTTPFSVTRSRNSPGGYIKGVEVNIQKPFTFLPGFLSHFGASANYTYVKSSVVYFLSTAANAPSTNDQFVNVSPHAVNATLFYDDSRFSAHVSGAYRSAYLIALPFRAGLAEGFYSYATTNVDASFSFAVTKRIKITGDALNLTDQKGDQYSGKTRKAQRVFSTTGRQFFLGASLSF